MRKLILFIYFSTFCTASSFAVHQQITKTQQKSDRSKKIEKKIEKALKQYEKKKVTAKQLLKKPQPWLSIILALGAVGMIILGIIASFGLANGIATVFVISGLLLATFGCFVSLLTFRKRGESKNKVLTTVLSTVAFIISACISILALIGIVNTIIN